MVSELIQAQSTCPCFVSPFLPEADPDFEITEEDTLMSHKYQDNIS